jgi:predicted metal-binding protein
LLRPRRASCEEEPGLKDTDGGPLADATPTPDITAIAGAANPVTTSPVTISPVTIYVCVTCRGGKPPGVVPVPGEVLAASTVRAAQGTGIAVREVRCLANCNRGLSAAVRRDGAWTYVFGDLDPADGAAALVDGARLFSAAADGLMPWRGRPDALKRGLVARTPPFDVSGDDL